MKRILLLTLALVASLHTAALAQDAWETTCPVASINIEAPNSVAIGETFDLVVTITNNGTSPMYGFESMVGYIDPGYNDPISDPMSLLDHFIILDVHSSRGQPELWTLDWYDELQEEYNLASYIEWELDEDRQRQWLLPGETATLRITLRAVGTPGSLEIPAAINYRYYDENIGDDVILDCPNSTDKVAINITAGSIAEPMLVEKVLLAPNFYDCVPMGYEITVLWQIRNTSDEPIYVRFEDVVPGKALNYINDVIFSSVEDGTSSHGSYLVNFDLDKATGNGTMSTYQRMEILPGNMMTVIGFMDVTKFAQPSQLTSPFKVWLTDSQDYNESNIVPNDAMEFSNDPLPVCDPIITKTVIGTYCDVREGNIIEYEVTVDRFYFDNSSAYIFFKDEHPAGTSYQPFTHVGNAENTFTLNVDPQTTYWFFSDNYVDNVDEDLYEESSHTDETDYGVPDHDDHIVLRYRVRVDGNPTGSLVNTFTMYSGSRDYNYGYYDDKIVAGKSTASRSSRDRDLEDESNSQSSQINGLSMFYSYLEEAAVAGQVSHTLTQDCYFIDGYKFEDLNGNGRRDTGEPGVESWRITAQSSEGTFTAVTDAEGYYRFDGIPQATWQVRESYQLGWVQSAPGGEGFYNVQISDQVKSARLDFGNWKFAEISGVKYHDIDGSGSQGNGEPGVEGVRIELRGLGGELVTYTYTDGIGRYGFAQVPPGHYAVYEEANPSWRQSQPGPAEGGYHYVVTTSGSSHPGKDFGNYEPVSIFGSVVQVNAKTTEHDPTVRDFRDLKIQLVRMGPSGEPEPQKAAAGTGNASGAAAGAVSGGTIGASGGSGSNGPETASINTFFLDLDENGAFEANGLQPGDWQVSVVLAEFWSAVSSNPVDVFIPSGDAADIGFEVYFDGLAAPELRTSSITGSVFRNTTAEHLFDKDVDVMVAGQTVRLMGTSSRGASVDLQVTTGTDGSYRFVDLPAGNYTVSLGGVEDSLNVGWPWADTHRVILADNQHVGTTFVAQEAANTPAPFDYDLAWKSQAWSAYGNLWMRIDDDGDDRADRRNFFSGGAALARTSTNGTWPMVVAHTDLQMAGTDSLGRTIRAVSPAGGSHAILSTASKQSAQALGGDIAGHATTQPTTQALGTWTQGLDLNLDLAEGLWYGPTASSMSNEPAIVAATGISEWLSLHTTVDFTAAVGAAPVLRSPQGTPVATVLSARYVLTPGPDFGLTPKRFDADSDGSGDGEDDGGTGSGGGGIGTNDPDDRADVPREFALGSNYPNPFNPSTVVPFELAAAGHVTLAVYDVMGRRVAILMNGTMSAGRHTLTWDAAGLPSGVYMVRLTAGGKVMTSKATLLK